jgi:hypothetical protein
MIHVNAQRLWTTLEMLAQIGGTPAGGVTRLALSEEDRIARNLLRDWALEAGLTCDVDSMGNMFIRRVGKNSTLAPVMTGLTRRLPAARRQLRWHLRRAGRAGSATHAERSPGADRARYRAGELD